MDILKNKDFWINNYKCFILGYGKNRRAKKVFLQNAIDWLYNFKGLKLDEIETASEIIKKYLKGI